jgi:uncharacterized protein (TIGR02996 family)
MSAEDGFLRAIRERPDDPTARLAYADWLDEQGDPQGAARAAFLRAQAALAGLAPDDPRLAGLTARLRQLARDAEPSWRRLVAVSAIENCDVARFEFRCPRRWDQLQPTEGDEVRFCDACRHNVYYCASLADARGHASLGRCVAVDLGVPRAAGDLQAEEHMLTGLLLPDPEELERLRRREQEAPGTMSTQAAAWNILNAYLRRPGPARETGAVEPDAPRADRPSGVNPPRGFWRSLLRRLLP